MWGRPNFPTKLSTGIEASPGCLLMTAIARVAIDVPVDTLFHYLQGPATTTDIGRRVVVPFGRREAIGVLHSFLGEEPSDRALKPILRVLDDILPLDRTILALLDFSARYYHHPLGSAIVSALPRRLRQTAALRRPRAPAHSEEPNSTEVAAPALTPDQKRAVELICAAHDEYRPWLLLGITGSGKTEMYLRVLQEVISRGRQVLYLVPEINLTPQLEAFLCRRAAGARLVSLHSALADGERGRNWIAAQSGDADIVLGRVSLCLPRCRGLVSSWWTRSMTVPLSSRTECATLQGT